jgi:hypothetical protein
MPRKNATLRAHFGRLYVRKEARLLDEPISGEGLLKARLRYDQKLAGNLAAEKFSSVTKSNE